MRAKQKVKMPAAIQEDISAAAIVRSGTILQLSLSLPRSGPDLWQKPVRVTTDR